MDPFRRWSLAMDSPKFWCGIWCSITMIDRRKIALKDLRLRVLCKQTWQPNSQCRSTDWIWGVTTAKFYYQRNPESASFLVALSMVQWWRISPPADHFLRCVSFVGNSTRNHSACRRFIMDMFTFVARFLPDSPHGECHVSSFPDQIEQHSLLRCNESQAQVWYRPKVSLIIDLEWRFRIKIV